MTDNFAIAYGFAAYTFAYDVATVDAEGSIKFALEHPLAYVKVQVEATDYVKNWKLKGVQIVDRTGAAKLAGDYTIDTTTGELTVTNGTPSVDQYFKYVTSTIANTSNYSTRYITIVTLPWDFTGSEVWVVAKFEDDKGNIIYVPTKYENAKLKAGAWNIIKLNLTADSQSVKSFYEPLDTRLMPGLGYAYGEQNTYLIQCKNGSTYTGGTYTPNADIPGSVKVDIRGRGDFSKIADISKATFEWYKKGVFTNGNGNGNDIYVPQTMDASKSGINSTAFTIDDSPKAEGYITVTNTGAYAGAPILLMKVDNKVVWSWAFWNIAADGTKLEEVKYGDYTLANMAIGQPTTDMTAWKGNAEVVWQYLHMYQWGRPMPIYKRSYNSFYDLLTGGSGHIPVIRTEPLTLAESIEMPVGSIMSTAAATEQKKWGSEDLYLWGGSEKNEARVGVKTVYDPCPKGWRVMDVAVANYLRDNATATYTSTAAVIGSSLTAGGTDSYWIIAGRLDGKTNASDNQFASDGTGKYWTNYLEGGGNTASAGYVLTVNKSNSKPTRNTHPRSTAMAVRCQKDVDNR
jgi:hypothetical protein